MPNTHADPSPTARLAMLTPVDVWSTMRSAVGSILNSVGELPDEQHATHTAPSPNATEPGPLGTGMLATTVPFAGLIFSKAPSSRAQSDPPPAARVRWPAPP